MVVRELWHARELFGDDLEGLVSVLPPGGSAVLHAVGAAVHPPRAAAVTFASHVPAVRVPAATAVKWRGQVETRVRTLLVMTTGEGCRWGDAAEYAEVLVTADGDTSDEGLLADNHNESDGSDGDASSDGGWSSDSDQGREATAEDPTTFVLRIATLNVRGYQRKKTEVPATALRHKVDVLALTETRSRTQGRVEGEDYDLWESGANRAQGKALLVHTGSQISAEPEAVTEDVFVVTVRYREKYLVRIGVVYATPDRPEGEVLDGLQDVVQRYPGPLVLVGDFDKDTLRCPMYQHRLRTWGYTAYPTGWTWTWRGAGAHAHERSMIDFILAPTDMQIAQVQVLGRIPVRTDHRIVVAEVQIKGTHRMAPMGAQPRPARTRHQHVTAEQWQRFRKEHNRWAQRYAPHPVLPV